MRDLLKDFPVVRDLDVAWGDMDAFRHVNNVVYFRYFESARLAYFEKLNLWDLMDDTGGGPILASAQCQYKLPLTYPDTISVGIHVPRLEADRFVMKFRIVSHRHRRIAAEGDGLIVWYDYREQKKMLIPAEMRARILALEGPAAATDG